MEYGIKGKELLEFVWETRWARVCETRPRERESERK